MEGLPRFLYKEFLGFGKGWGKEGLGICWENFGEGWDFFHYIYFYFPVKRIDIKKEFISVIWLILLKIVEPVAHCNK